MVREEKLAMRFWRLEERPSREWWAVLGTVTEALEGFGSAGLESEFCWACVCEFDAAVVVVADVGGGGGGFFLKYDGGKCFALYVSWTLASSCRRGLDSTWL